MEELGRELIEEEILSREYKIFRGEALREKNWYEKGASFFGRILEIKPTKELEESLSKAIELGELALEPKEVLSFLVLAPLFLFLAILFLFFLPIPTSIKILAFLSPFVFAYYIYYYPFNKAVERRIEASNQSVIVILYLAIYLRFKANMEGALSFAATRLEGPLSNDIKKLLWDVKLGKYTNVFDAISAYTEKWEMESREFVESLRVLQASFSEPNEERRIGIIDRAMDIVLEGLSSKMKNYSQELRLPTMVLHGIGVTLPLITLVMFPMMSMFMTEIIRPEFLVLGYNILLPLVIYHLIRRFLVNRPGTIGPADISEHPDIPKEKSMLVFGYNLPLIYPAIFIFILVSLPGFLNIDKIISLETGTAGALYSLVFIWAVSLSLGFYFLLTSYQKIEIRKKVEAVEREFGDALFQLGNKLAGGVPLEFALERCIDSIRGAEISDLFIRILTNIRKFGMTLESAIFDPELGAIRYYPHKLLKDILRTIVDTARKGVQFASLSMITISRYLKNMYDVEQNIFEIMGEVLASMKFESYLLSPIVAASAVGMGVTISNIFNVLSESLGGLLPGVGVEGLSMFTLNFSKSIPSGILQIIVGTYMIEIVTLLCIFTNRIKYGYDSISRDNLIGKTLLITTFLYTVILIGIIVEFKTILPLEALI